MDTVSELDAPEALENFEEFVVLDSEVPELALEMSTKAVVAIQGLVEGWVGGRGRSDHTSEAGVVALLKRVRGDLNRYKLQAADTPIDLHESQERCARRLSRSLGSSLMKAF